MNGDVAQQAVAHADVFDRASAFHDFHIRHGNALRQCCIPRAEEDLGVKNASQAKKVLHTTVNLVF